MASNKTTTMKAPEPKVVSQDKYFRLLEDYHRVSSNLESMRDQFQKEYQYAEEQMRQVAIMTDFIEADKERSKNYKEYLKSLTANK